MPIELRVPVKADAFAAAIEGERRHRRAAGASAREVDAEAARDLGAGRVTRVVARGRRLPGAAAGETLAATFSSDLTATDGQTLGYTWAGVVENWHQRAFTSFGDGHGVWEKGGGTLLPFYARNFPAVRSGSRRSIPSS